MGEGDAEARSARLAAQRESKRSRLIRIGELVEELAPYCHQQGRHPLDQHNAEWSKGTTLLRQALVGFSDHELPMCHQLAQGTPRQIVEKATVGMARNEVEQALAALRSEAP